MPDATIAVVEKKLKKIKGKRKLSAHDVVSINDLTQQDVALIFDMANVFKKDFISRSDKKLSILKGKTIINLFFETSTRTRTSFEIAGKELGADTINISGDATSMAKKMETLHDTICTLNAMKTDCIIVRHSKSGAPKLIADALDAPVINAGDAWHEHPTQALLDCFTIIERLGAVKNKHVLIVGDIMHSRVFGSLARLLKKMGAEVRVASPATMIPAHVAEEFGVRVYTAIEEALPGTDVVYVLRVQIERAAGDFIPTLREYSKLYNITPARLSLAKKTAIVMHPGPVNRDIDVSNTVMESKQCAVEDEVQNGYCIRLALLYLLLGNNY